MTFKLSLFICLTLAYFAHAATVVVSAGDSEITLRNRGGGAKFVGANKGRTSDAVVVSSFAWGGVSQGSLKTLTLTHNVDLNSPALANAAINHVAYDSLEFSILSTVNYRSPASLFSMSNCFVLSTSWTGDTKTIPVETIVLSCDSVTLTRTESYGSTNAQLRGQPDATVPPPPSTTSFPQTA